MTPGERHSPRPPPKAQYVHLHSLDYSEHTKHNNLVCLLNSGKRLFQYLKGTEKFVKAVRDLPQRGEGTPSFLSTVLKSLKPAGFLADPNYLQRADVCFSLYFK